MDCWSNVKYNEISSGCLILKVHINPLFQYSITPSSAKRGAGFPPPPLLSKVIARSDSDEAIP